jgi:UDP-hydrolysing UDP-N-acetyl-D-glucosamine 2-epimerase
MVRVLSISSSRADVGVLQTVWRALVAKPDCELHVMLTGMHCKGGAIAEVPKGAISHTGGADLGGSTAGEAVAAMAAILRAVGDVLTRVSPDVVLVIGDRLDMLPAAVAALPFNCPIAHLHGGEVTSGAIDDRVRHALTKIAHLHFVSSETSRARLIAMGEDESRIHVTGAPGLDTLVAAPFVSREEFCAAVGFDGIEAETGIRLVTVHPETNSPDPIAPLTAVLGALAARPGQVLITAPNSDPGGKEMLGRIEAFCAKHPNARFIDTLGAKLYASALRHASVMAGNSSSGIIEAGLFGLPVIDVGGRQKGRDRGANVTHVENDCDAVIAALDSIRPGARYPSSSPYGDGHAAPRIADLLTQLPPHPALLNKPAPYIGHEVRPC